MGSDIAKRRHRVVARARVLARSGEHQDHSSIALALRTAEVSKAALDWFEDARFLAQLDQLCALARQPISVGRYRRPTLASHQA